MAKWDAPTAPFTLGLYVHVVGPSVHPVVVFELVFHRLAVRVELLHARTDKDWELIHTCFRAETHSTDGDFIRKFVIG